MAKVIVGKWGKNLAVRLPGDIARRAGIGNGELVDISTRGADIVIRRKAADARAAAQAAADEIIAEGEQFSLGDISISELVNEGRRK
jgi:antitoxin component of MazEF toxin-antitoxin module